jgi:hypothetical protein
MYPKKVSYFKTKYKEENCASGIITTSVEWLTVGTPCIASVNPFRAQLQLPDADIVANIDQNLYYKGDSRRPENLPTIKMKDIYEIAAKRGIDEANAIIRNNLSSVQATFVFTNWNDKFDYFSKPVNSRQFRFDGKKPIIFDDNFKQINLNSQKDMHKSEDLSNVADKVLKYLKDYRYVNYIFRRVAESNKKSVIESMDSIFKNMASRFPMGVCFRQHGSNRTRFLIDTLCVSFYRLSDVIPVFDYRNLGVGIEVVMTNSQAEGEDMQANGMSLCYRFLFSESSENVFTIDGEKIERPNDISVSDGVKYMKAKIDREVPNDFALTNKPVLLKKSAQEEI